MKILIPVDGSSGSDKAIRFALFLLKGKEAEITLINVQNSYNTLKIKLGSIPEPIEKFQEEDAKEVLDHAREIIAGWPLPVHALVRTGDPGKEICAEAKESGVDMIVMGHRGMGAVESIFIGSVAHHVLHEQTCPVLIVQ